MRRFGQKDPNWQVFAKDFVLNIKNNPVVETFVKSVHDAKIEVERTMRRDLDSKIMQLGVGNIYFSLGKELIKRLRTYIKYLKIYKPTVTTDNKRRQKSSQPGEAD